MAYDDDKKPSELTALTSLADDDVVIIGDTSDTGEVVKQITWANLKTLINALITAAVVSVETPSGTVNAVNDTFTVTAEPKYIIADGISYFDGDGYTYSTLTVTMDIPPSSFIKAVL